MVIGLFYWIFYSLILLVAYHKIFTVYYLDFSGGLLRELLISGLLGAVLAGLSILYWQFGVIVIVLLALIAIAKAESAFAKTVILIVAITGCIVVGIISHRLKQDIQTVQSGQSEEEDDWAYEEATETEWESEEDDTYVYEEAAETEWDSKEDDTYVYYEDDSGIWTEEVDETSEDFIFPDSDMEYLLEMNLDGLSAESCRIARNEIYARHGRIFDDVQLQSYFESKDWYTGIYHANEFDDSVLNEYEKNNLQLILEYESKMGYR